MKKYWILALVFALTVASGTWAPKPAAAQKKNHINKAASPIVNKYIVVLNEGDVGRDAVETQVEARGQYLANAFGGKLGRVYANAVKAMSMEMTEEQAGAMLSDPSVSSIEEDGMISISAQNNAEWHLDRIDQRNLPLNSVYDTSGNGAGVHVYILDTGVRYTHSDFGGRANWVYDNINDGQNGNDCNGHGTHVAGIVGSATYGVAKNVSIHSVRVLPCNGLGQISDLLAGVDWVTAHKIAPAVANISITAPGTSPALELGITNSIASGVTYAIAAGNNTQDACNFTPARTPNALTVAASYINDTQTWYSNFGPCVDVFAPGTGITSLSSLNDVDINVLTGTSMSSPQVAGTAALYLGAHPTANPTAVANAIKGAATTGIITAISPNTANLLLYSWVNASAPAPTPTPIPSPSPTPVPTPTPTPLPSPTPGQPTPARVKVRKNVTNSTGSSSTVSFPYAATNLASSSFVLVDNSLYDDPNVPVTSGSTNVVVTEQPVEGWQLISIGCIEVSTGTPTMVNSTVDLLNHKANILAEPGEDVTCTFTSEPITPSAGGASISGRVTRADGMPARNVRLLLIDVTSGVRYGTLSNSFGYYTFADMPVSDLYTLTPMSNGRYRISSEPFTFRLLDDLAEMNFVVNIEP